jgi:tetratricopeptide (TPR) repeat protein
VEDAPLYEALNKRFPAPSPESDSMRANARTVCLVAFIAQGRTKDAAALLADRQWNGNDRAIVGRQITELLTGQGLTRQVRDFLQEALTNDPGLELWDVDIDLSARLGEADEALAFLHKTLARTDLSASARETVDREYSKALLAADQIDQGLDALRASMKADAGTHITAPGAPEVYPEETVWISTGAPLRLAEIGHLLGRPELLEEGLDAARAEIGKAQPSQGPSLAQGLARFLSRLGRRAEAEKLLVDQMLALPKNEGYFLLRMNEQLAVIYHEAGRYEDVLKLLDQSPDWPAADLAECGNVGEDVPLLFCAAKALAVAGRKEEARRVLDRLLKQRGGYDPAYALLLEMGGDGVEAKLDALAQRDRFEERPLIWKAKLQLDAGRVEEAEKTVRAAIAIDPSDGKEGKGDRMRAYAVLGDVLEKKGDMDQAKIMRGAVEAIRLSENADDWWQAGLLTRAVKMYEEALGHFADAYCIQSRLALRYSELGDLAKAEQHYQRAFELMPESFGRIESHCFGCEHAFEGERAQNIAESVFTKLAKKADARPQVFYLLGYLREEQKRDADAATQYQRAVKLDPDYFNAWSRLSGVGSVVDLPTQEMEAAQLALLRLDPTLHHHQPNFEGFRNLSRLWDAVLAAEKARPPIETGPVYPLPAAKAELERREQAAKTAGGMVASNYQEHLSFRQQREQTENLRPHFAQQPTLTGIARILETFINHQDIPGT